MNHVKRHVSRSYFRAVTWSIQNLKSRGSLLKRQVFMTWKSLSFRLYDWKTLKVYKKLNSFDYILLIYCWKMAFVIFFLSVFIQYAIANGEPTPPPASEAAKLARYVLHYSGKYSYYVHYVEIFATNIKKKINMSWRVNHSQICYEGWKHTIKYLATSTNIFSKFIHSKFFLKFKVHSFNDKNIFLSRNAKCWCQSDC